MSGASPVLVCNPGSSSIKWTCYPSLQQLQPLRSGKAALKEMGQRLAELLDTWHPALCLVRCVHGGHRFVAPTLVDSEVFDELEGMSDLALLHNGASLACLRLLRDQVPDARLVAVFDTEFFHQLPEVAQRYGLPEPLVAKYGLRRFGFHGFAHAGMARRWEGLREPGAPSVSADYRLITAQLGSGCSMAAIRAGRPIDTTMGFSPNEGLLMSTRCGDLDPGLLTWLQRREGWDPARTDEVLNSASGWLGMSGESAELGVLLASDSAGARRALDLFAHRFRKTLGAYHALLGGLDAVMLSGGVAEHAPAFCRRLLADLGHLGIHATEQDEQGLKQEMLRLSAEESPVQCWLVAGNEDESMVEAVLRAGLDNLDKGRRQR